MWIKPWKIKEALFIGGGLVLTGLLLQFTIGPIKWDLFAFPVNLIFLIFWVLLILGSWLLRERFYLLRWMSSSQAAVGAIAWVALLTLIMGLTKQVGADASPSDPIGITKMLSHWAFVLVYMWMTYILGLVILRQVTHFTWRGVPFLVSHLGLFLVLTCGTLGSADMQRLRLGAELEAEVPEWRGLDDKNKVHELDFAVQLNSFIMDTYPPKLIVIDSKSGDALPRGKSDVLSLEDSLAHGHLNGWEIHVKQYLPFAALVPEGGKLKAVAWGSAGAIPAAMVEVINPTTHHRVSGWVSCGSFYFPMQVLPLDAKTAVAMPQLEPRRFASDVTVYTKDGHKLRDTIDVNKPLSINGWKMYQLDYDHDRGRWSQYSVFELVRDPWLPYVYVGIALLLLGAILMFVMGSRRK